MAVTNDDGGAVSVIRRFQAPERLWSRAELIALRPNPIPPAPGLYGWYFDELPDDAVGPVGTTVGQWRLLYVGIAPGRPGSQSNLRRRLRNHVSGNARGSTLRLTLGCLLSERLGLSPVAASGKLHFGPGEALLNAWLDAHARVAWVEHPAPWEVERDVVRGLGVPLNRGHNEAHPFYTRVGEARATLRSALLQ